MTIWVDADACPRAIKDVLFRAAERRAVPVTLVANQPLAVPRGRFVTAVRVAPGFDVADHHIVASAGPGDLVITADIPLAAEVVEKGALALTPRGEPLTAESVGERLDMRNLADTLRNVGLVSGGPPTFTPRDVQAFARRLDSFISRGRF